MLSTTLWRVEVAGVIFWLVSLFCVRRGTPLVVVVWHLVAAALSFAAPLAGAIWALDEPAKPVLWLWLLGFLNGLLGAAWCAYVEPKVSKLPMLGFAFGGIVLVTMIALSSFSMTRMF
jgi:hypothetical protein